MSTLPLGRGRGMPRPYRVVIFQFAVTAQRQGGVKTPPYNPTIREKQTVKRRSFRKFYRRSRKTGAGGRGVKKCVLTIF